MTFVETGLRCFTVFSILPFLMTVSKLKILQEGGALATTGSASSSILLILDSCGFEAHNTGFVMNNTYHDISFSLRLLAYTNYSPCTNSTFLRSFGRRKFNTVWTSRFSRIHRHTVRFACSAVIFGVSDVEECILL